MKQTLKPTIVLLIALLLPAPALADLQQAQGCAADLSPSASEVFQESLKAMRAGKEPQEAVADEVKRLVADGTLQKEYARDVTKAAVQCMKLLKP